MCKPDSLKLRWNANSHIPVTQYNVIYRKEGDETRIQCSPLLIEDAKNELLDFCVDDLEPDTVYEVCVVAVNGAGESSEDDSVVLLRTALPGRSVFVANCGSLRLFEQFYRKKILK